MKFGTKSHRSKSQRTKRAQAQWAPGGIFWHFTKALNIKLNIFDLVPIARIARIVVLKSNLVHS